MVHAYGTSSTAECILESTSLSCVAHRSRIPYTVMLSCDLVKTYGLPLHVVYVNLFSDGAPPDGTPEEERQTFKIGLIVLFDVLAALGLLFTVACLLFNVIFKNKRYA